MGESLREMQRYDKYGSGRRIRERLAKVTGTLDTVNVDMIFNFPHQTEASLRRDLRILTDDLAADQVSFYPLMTDDNVRKAMHATMGVVDHSRERHYYEIIAEHMLAAGYKRNSAWCFSANPGMFDEYIVNHEEYLGLGSGAFSYLQGALYSSTFSIAQYLELVQEGQSGCVYRQAMSEREQMRYYLLMRLFGGTLDKAAAQTRFEGRFLDGVWKELSALEFLGAIRDRGATFALTEKGNYIWVMIMREFFSGINRLRDHMRHTNLNGNVAAQAGE